MMRLDHLAVACTDLTEGVDWVQDRLGVSLQAGGQHTRYGTHNMLLGLGDDLYLEVIAPDPNAVPEAGHCWFGLDHFTGPPRLANWVCAVEDIAAVPAFAGPPRALTRGDLAWQITVLDDGSLPYHGAYPTLIEWAEGTLHPAKRLKDSGCRLTRLVIAHPDMDRLRCQIEIAEDRVSLETCPFSMSATFDTANGTRIL